MKHLVQPGDTLWRLAGRYFGDPEKWRIICQDNPHVAPRQLIVGDELVIRQSLVAGGDQGARLALMDVPGSAKDQEPSLIPGRAYLFVVANEVDPLTRKVVRRVIVNPKEAANWSAKLGRPVRYFPDPDAFGFVPDDMNSPVSLGRHAQGLKPSPFISASDHLLGARRISGPPFWIDIEKARAAGATVHETDEVLKELNEIIARTKKPAQVTRLMNIRRTVMADAEVILRGPIPASAVKGPTAMALTRMAQGVQVVGFVMTAVDLGEAGQASLRTHSVRPIAAESIRQIGGWAGAWAGVKLGGAAGAAVGVETGPGAVITAVAGSMILGVAGYCAFDWAADLLHEN